MTAARDLEDACLVLWAEMDVEDVKRLAEDFPQLAGFLAHLHHSIEHEQAMVRTNVWAIRAAQEPSQ